MQQSEPERQNSSDWVEETLRINGRDRHPDRVYRFYSDQQFERVWDVLIGNEFYLAPPASFNDVLDSEVELVLDDGDALVKYVCDLRAKAGEQFEASPGNPEFIADCRTRVEKAVREARERIGVCCFAANNTDPLLWAHYARGHRGLAFEFDGNRLHDAGIALVPVRYSATRPSLRPGIDDFEMLYVSTLCKALDWKYEAEYRIAEIKSASFTLPFPLESITAIHFGMRASEDFITKVARMLQSHKSPHARSLVPLLRARKLTPAVGGWERVEVEFNH